MVSLDFEDIDDKPQEEPEEDKNKFIRSIAVPIKPEDYPQKPVEVKVDDYTEVLKVIDVIRNYSTLKYDDKYKMATRGFVEGKLHELKRVELGLNEKSELPKKDGEEITEILNKVFDDKKVYLLKVGTPRGEDMEHYHIVNPWLILKQNIFEDRLKKDAMPKSQKLQDSLPGFEQEK